MTKDPIFEGLLSYEAAAVARGDRGGAPSPMPDYQELYFQAAGHAIDLAQELDALRQELTAERKAHLEHCRKLEEYRTLADYRQGKLERRVATEDRRKVHGIPPAPRAILEPWLTRTGTQRRGNRI